MAKADGDAAELSVCVNISSRELIRHDLVRDIRHSITKADPRRNCFRLELTKSLVMENPENSTNYTKHRGARHRPVARRFRHRLFVFCLSARFPFDTIKIDKSFVDDNTPKRAVLLKSMVNMAHELGLSVVAEGISDERDALELRQMGCECAKLYVRRTDAGRPGPEDVEGTVPADALRGRLETLLLQPSDGAFCASGAHVPKVRSAPVLEITII